jgi:hypothetical protein
MSRCCGGPHRPWWEFVGGDWPVPKENLTVLRSASGFFGLLQFLAFASIVAHFDFGEVARYFWEGVKALCYVFLAVFLAFTVLSFLGKSFRRWRL